MTVAILDFSKPPPGYTISWLTHAAPEWVFRVGERDNFNQYRSESEARGAAWAKYKAENDPPGMYELWYGAFAANWAPPFADDASPIEREAAVRAAAWAWYERRRVLYDEAMQVVDHELWPALLTCTDAQADVAERWLHAPTLTSPVPEVLHG